MATEQGQAPNADAFDAYFRRADLDQDGRISGAEAVAFFQGSNLPKETLALVWSYAAGRNNFLGRMEFYNALRLVTVAQSGRQLTADIVKAALYGPAAAKIPAPKINPAPAPVIQANQAPLQATQTGFMRPPTAQMNSMAVSAPLTNNILPQMTTAPLRQHFQSGFMRPPSSQLSMAIASPQENSMMQQPPQVAFMRPQMNSNLISVPQANNTLLQPSQASFARPPAFQNTGLTAQQMPIATGVNHQGSFPSQNNVMRPLQSSQVQGFSQGFHTASIALSTGLPNSNSSPLPFADKDGLGIMHTAHDSTLKPQIQHLISSSTSKSLEPLPTSSQTTSKDSKTAVISGNGFSSDSVFGGDAFSATQTKQNLSNSSNLPPVASKNPVNTSQHANLQGMPGLPPATTQRNQSFVKQSQPETLQGASVLPAYSIPGGSDSSASAQNEVSWPKITQSDIRKYTKVFLEVDKDRDGKITGVEARNLFLSWRLPREVLRQVWDLSDQDNDSMLSMREFCVSLYLMERYREGRPLPSVLPNSVKFDQTLILATGQPSSTFGASAWQPKPVLSQQPIPESLSIVPSTRMEPSRRTPIPSQPGDISPVQQKARVPELEKNMLNQLSEEEQKALSSKLQEAIDADNKVQELEKEILDYKKKTENYSKQMQDLVLYKSRCDSRLNEIIEKSAADRREIELLARKYEEKYKQMGDVASQKNVDQATFRDMQERKMELYNAIVKMEQGEISDGVLQERAEKIQTDLDELVKALNEWCKESGLRAKPTSLVELPFGWQPGIQESAADWDESWDKFDKDDGFTIIKELTLEVENVIAPEISKTTSVTSVEAATKAPNESDQATKDEKLASSNESDKATKDEKLASFAKAEGKIDESSNVKEHLTEAELPNVHGEDGSVRSPSGSSVRSTMESPSREFQSAFSTYATVKDHHSEFDGAESTVSGEKFTDEVTWGATFDTDDTDSLWGFDPIKTKETAHDVRGDFPPNSFGTDSPTAGSIFGKERSPFFDSVPSTPAFDSVFSPKFNESPEDHHRSFDSFSRFDSFSTNDGFFGLSTTSTGFDSIRSPTDPSRHTFSRFDSFSSTADTQKEFSRFDSMRSTADTQREFSRFDSMRSTADTQREFSRFDSMRSTVDTEREFSRFDSISNKADTKREFSRFDSMSSTADSQFGRFDSMHGAGEPRRETLARFDSIRSTGDFNHGFSFDDSDPFGSGPFKTSESYTTKKSTDHWSSF